MTDFDKWLKSESEKDKNKECKARDNNCYGCPYEEDCSHEDLINNLEEW